MKDPLFRFSRFDGGAVSTEVFWISGFLQSFKHCFFFTCYLMEGKSQSYLKHSAASGKFRACTCQSKTQLHNHSHNIGVDGGPKYVMACAQDPRSWSISGKLRTGLMQAEHLAFDRHILNWHRWRKQLLTDISSVNAHEDPWMVKMFKKSPHLKKRKTLLDPPPLICIHTKLYWVLPWPTADPSTKFHVNQLSCLCVILLTN